MDILHKVFEHEASRGAIATLATELLTKKLVEKGVRLSPSEKEKLREKLANQDFSGVTIRAWEFWKRKRIEIDITEQDLSALERSISEWTDQIPPFLVSLSDTLAVEVLKDLKKRWPREGRTYQREVRAFQARLESQWTLPLGLLTMLLAISEEFGDSMNARLRCSRSGSHAVEALTRLHARSCQVGFEILALLRNGFADGAVARWRTLHEIAVVMLFIAEHGESLAERYLLHEAVESRRAALEYQKFCDALGCEPISPDELRRMEDTHSGLIKHFGPEFGERYGWAGDQLGSGRPTFADIEKAVQFDHLRPYYRMASHNVHANPKGVFFKLGLFDEEGLLLAGPSNYGLADPGQNTAISVAQVATALVRLDITLDSVVAVKLMQTLSFEVAARFAAAQRQLESKSA